MTTHEMSNHDVTAFLAADPPQTAKLATVRGDGRPHLAPVWFALDGDTVVFNTGTDTVKGRNLRRDGRIALCVDDPTPPFTFVTIEGVAELDDDLDEVRRWAMVIAGRYMGADRAEEFGERNGVPGELLVRVRPTKVLAVRDLAG